MVKRDIYKQKTYQDTKRELSKYDLSLTSSPIYDKKWNVVDEEYYIHTPEDSSVGMFGTDTGKSGRIYKYENFNNLKKDVFNKNTISKITDDLYAD